MASSRRRKVQCDDHGDSNPWMVCRHLREGRRLDFHWIESDPQNDTDAALCDACANLLLAEDAWTDRLWDFADWRLYCEKCWKREKRRRGHRLICRGRSVQEPKPRRRKRRPA